MFHLRLLLKFPVHHCTLQLPPVTSHHSKNSALNRLPSGLYFLLLHSKGRGQTNPSPDQPFRALHIPSSLQELQILWDRVGQRKNSLVWHKIREIPRGMPVPQCTGTGCWEQDQCQQELCLSCVHPSAVSSLTVSRDLRPPHTEPRFACSSLGSD